MDGSVTRIVSGISINDTSDTESSQTETDDNFQSCVIHSIENTAIRNNEFNC